MSLFIISIPVMALAVAIAVVPLVLLSRREIAQLAEEAERRHPRHHRVHDARARHQRELRRGAGVARPVSRASNERAWHQPVLIERA